MQDDLQLIGSVLNFWHFECIYFSACVRVYTDTLVQCITLLSIHFYYISVSVTISRAGMWRNVCETYFDKLCEYNWIESVKCINICVWKYITLSAWNNMENMAIDFIQQTINSICSLFRNVANNPYTLIHFFIYSFSSRSPLFSVVHYRRSLLSSSWTFTH